MSQHPNPVKMVAAAVPTASAFFAMGPQSDPNLPRLANATDWERCLVHPARVVPLSPGQSYTSNRIHNATDGARAGVIWISPIFVAFFGYGYIALAIWAVLIIGAVILRCLKR